VSSAGRAPVRHWSVPLFAAGLVTGFVVIGTVLAMHGQDREGWLLAARYTARTSALWFLLAFGIGPLARRLRSPPILALLRERRGLGLGFAAAHGVHFMALVMALRAGVERPAVVLVVGGLAYAFVLAMALTSNDRAVAWLGPRRWRVLHGVGIHVIWLVFTLSYLGRVLQPPVAAVHAVLFGLFVAAMGLRLAARRTAR